MLNYKRPRFWLYMVIVISVIIISVERLANTNDIKPSSSSSVKKPDEVKVLFEQQLGDLRKDNREQVLIEAEMEISSNITGTVSGSNYEETTEKHKSEQIKRNEPIDNDIAEYITYDYENNSIYIAGLKIFKEFSTDEFGYSNEGGASINEDVNVLTFDMTTATGTITGALDGPVVYFEMDFDTNSIIKKEFEPAPNYAEWGKTEFIEYSGKVIELSDECMIEIGLYFKDFISKIEAR